MDKTLFWKNRPGSPLLVIFPGGTGSHRPQSRGSDVIAAHFWQLGYSCYISETAGQDHRPGGFSLKNCLDESRDSLKSAVAELNPESIRFFASCSGGAVAVSLAAETPATKAVVLWESPARFSPASTEMFLQRAKAQGMCFAEDFHEVIFHLENKLDELRIPVALGYGHCEGGAFTKDDLSQMRAAFKRAGRSLCEVEIPGADHSLTRGSNSSLLSLFLSRTTEFLTANEIPAVSQTDRP